MQVTTFISAWIVATVAMSSFSALWSIVTDSQFREHILLSHLLTKGDTHQLSWQQWLIGWVVHILLGAVFLASYELLWRTTGVIRSLSWSLVFGVVIGLVGILGWALMFKLHKNPPKLNFTHYYLHLLCAHIVFSVAAFGIYSLLN